MAEIENIIHKKDVNKHVHILVPGMESTSQLLSFRDGSH